MLAHSRGKSFKNESPVRTCCLRDLSRSESLPSGSPVPAFGACPPRSHDKHLARMSSRLDASKSPRPFPSMSACFISIASRLPLVSFNFLEHAARLHHYCLEGRQSHEAGLCARRLGDKLSLRVVDRCLAFSLGLRVSICSGLISENVDRRRLDRKVCLSLGIEFESHKRLLGEECH